MRWSGTIPAGTTCRELASTIDVVPTVAKLIGADLPPHPIDGLDISELMRSDSARSPHDHLLCFYAPRSLHAVRTPRWKLHLPHPYRTLAGKPGGRDGQPVPYEAAEIGLSLFDLQADLGETTDLSAKHPEVVKELLTIADRARSELGDQLTRTPGTAVRPAGKMNPGDPRLTW
jgi:arylsulfatase A-like enzyme